MRVIPLASIPNQTVSIVVSEDTYDIGMRESEGVMLSSISKNGAVLYRNLPVVAGSPLLMFNHMKSGNFVFITLNDDIPWYESFSITQSLLYLTDDEISEL